MEDGPADGTPAAAGRGAGDRQATRRGYIVDINCKSVDSGGGPGESFERGVMAELVGEDGGKMGTTTTESSETTTELSDDNRIERQTSELVFK